MAHLHNLDQTAQNCVQFILLVTNRVDKGGLAQVLVYYVYLPNSDRIKVGYKILQYA